MKQTTKKKNIYDYLEPFLESDNAVDIAIARKNYWKEYKATWRKNKRKMQKEFTVAFTNKELQIINSEANKHKRSRTKFIKQASLAYCKNQFLIIDSFAVNHIRELLALNYNSLQQLSELNILSQHEGDKLMVRMADLEKNVLNALQNPNSLDKLIIDMVSKNTEIKKKIIQLLQTLPG